MSTITPAATFPVASPFNTNPAYSGTFIPAVWSAKMNAKFYAASTFADVSNTNWEGEVSGMGDKVIINTAPDITVSNYTAGTNLSYQAPTPSTQELVIDKGKYFAFQVNDVLAFQSQPNLIDMFSENAAEQMRTTVDSTCWYNTFSGADAANKGATAGVKSGSYDLGTDLAPVTLTTTNVLALILQMASVLDEQNIPESDRWLALDPYTRSLLFQSDLAKVDITGDGSSPVRNGMIGTIDRFKSYVTNHMPRAVAGIATPWLSGDGSENSVTSTSNLKRRVIIAGHKSALTFASQITKMETIRNPNDFGDYIRSLNVFGFKVVKPEAMTVAIVA
ncbi:MAG TPA: hypothetical protein PLE48_14495 [Thiobacillus sp.]|uniref:phage major capsid protein n=1 Tax=Acidovorax sp. TaxID=1872122 RepID=UPI002636D851|nr:hypothetical protein [Acidovorax sp.]HQT19224.1 hypothetical protein [Acidovorax defluvii]HQT71614.1 hypothetical protein [Thiobacillus sp.]